MGGTIYRWLMDRATGDGFDAHCFACAIAARCQEPEGTLAQRLGLNDEDLLAVMAQHFGGHRLDGLCPRTGERPLTPAIEEEDLRQLFLDHRAGHGPQEGWLAAIVARAAQHANHLWQDLGLTSREDVSRLLETHFPGLAALNVRNMKWKKFFYKQLCDREDIRICKAPNCEVCSDYAECFGPEDGPAPLQEALDGR